MAPVPGSSEQTMPEMETYWTLEKSAKTPVPASSVTFEGKEWSGYLDMTGWEGLGVLKLNSADRHVAGAGRDGLLRDGEVEFDHRRVCRPVGGSLALLLGVHRVEGQQRLVVPVEVDGTQEDLDVQRLRAADDLDVGVR